MDHRPTQLTKNPREHLLARTRAIVQRAEKPSKQYKIMYCVAGGPPSRRLEHTLQITGDGTVSLRHVDELAQARPRELKSTLTPERVTELFRDLLESRLLENVDTGGGAFLPDSIIGAITISDGMGTITYHFLADERRRRLKGIDLNPSVAKFSTVLQALSDTIMGGKDNS
jgi:hypothetical protein